MTENKVKRYEPECEVGAFMAEMVEQTSGEYVHHSDYMLLKDKLDEKQAHIENLNEAMADCFMVWDAMGADKDDDSGDMKEALEKLRVLFKNEPEGEK